MKWGYTKIVDNWLNFLYYSNNIYTSHTVGPVGLVYKNTKSGKKLERARF